MGRKYNRISKRKICFLSQYYGQVSRGAETYVLELAKRLSKNHDVDILIGKDSFSLNKILAGKYDIVIPTNGRWQALIVSIGSPFGGYKTIISGQAGIGKDDIWNIALTTPDFYTALTDFEMNWAKKWAWKTKVVKIPNGVDLEKFSSKGKKIDFNLENPVILSVGALEWYKHHERSIKAIKLLEKGSLLIIGQGPEKSKLQELGEKLLGNSRFKILQLNYDQLPEYYRSCDLFVLPSWEREAFGIVYLEAMASGLPVVSPDDSSRREIVGDAGIFCDTSDPEKYAAEIENALSKNWEDNPRNQASKFSWDLVAGEYDHLLKMIACSSGLP